MELILGIVTTMCIGLMIGTEFAVSVFVNPILEKLGDSAQAHATRLFARKLGTVMPFWYCLNFLFLIGETMGRGLPLAFCFIAVASRLDLILRGRGAGLLTFYSVGVRDRSGSIAVRGLGDD